LKRAKMFYRYICTHYFTPYLHVCVPADTILNVVGHSTKHKSNPSKTQNGDIIMADI